MLSKHLFQAARVLLMAGLLLAAARPARGQTADLFGRRIVAIEFECAEPIDRPGIARLMPMHVGDPLRADDVDEARWRLAQKEIFTSIRIDAEPRGADVAVVVRLVRKAIVNSISFHGTEALSDKELRRAVRLRESMALTDELLEYSIRHLRDRYGAEGFEDVRIGADVRARAPGEVDIIFDVAEGEPLRVGSVVIEGHLPLPEEEVRKAAGIGAGALYVRERQRTADKAIVRLFRDARYYEVQVESRWERGAGKRGTLRFTIDPGPPFNVEFSGNHRLKDKKLLALINLPQRPIVTDGTWRELARRAQHAYQEAGYYFARVTLSIDSGVPKTVHFTIEEGPRLHLAQVEFVGNRGLSAKQLRAAMATRPPSWFPWRTGVLMDDVLDEDLKRLWYLYRRHGYESAQIVDARTRFDREHGQIFLTVVVDEGPRTIVRAVERSGLEPIAKKLPDFAVKVGDPLDPDKVKSDREAMLTALGAAGYTHAEVTADVRTTPGETEEAATVRFEAKPGAAQHVGMIIVQNNIDTHAQVILRELPFKKGDPLDGGALLRGQSDIYKLGLFRSVTVRPLEEEPEPGPAAGGPSGALGVPEESVRAQTSPLPTGAAPAQPEAVPGQRPVLITVAEKPPKSIQWGAGYNTRDGFRGFVEISDDNLQGLARRLSLHGEFNLQPGDVVPNEYLGNLGFKEPRLDATRWTFRSNLIAQRSTRSVDQFSLERFAFIPALERSLRRNLRAGVEAQAEKSTVFDLASDVLAFNPRDEGQLVTIGLGPFVVYDGRDDAFVPRRGVFDSLRLRVAPEQFGSDIPFAKLQAQHTHYVPLDEDLTFVYVARGGWALPVHSGDIIPIRERFFLGGRTTVRGFSENQIGPKGTLDNPLGGDLVVNLNTELRFPLLYGFGGVVFVDGGGVYLEHGHGTPGTCTGCNSLSMHDFRRSSGLGLRYTTPVGPVSLEYGFKLDRRSDESVGEVHFSIGTVF